MKLIHGLIILGAILFTACSETNEVSIDTKKLDEKMDEWHSAAAIGDTEVYFDLMDESFIYLGTDISERWDKATFLTFCKPYFDKGSGWDFKATSRTWYSNQETIWFEENLTTWMGPIRASGVMINKNDEWKLTHYNLTLTVDNEQMQSFLKLNHVKG